MYNIRIEKTQRTPCTGARTSLTTLGILGINARPHAETKIATSKPIHHAKFGVSLMAVTKSHPNAAKRTSRLPEITAVTEARNLAKGPAKNARHTRGKAATQVSRMFTAMTTRFQVGNGSRVRPSILGIANLSWGSGPLNPPAAKSSQSRPSPLTLALPPHHATASAAQWATQTSRPSCHPQTHALSTDQVSRLSASPSPSDFSPPRLPATQPCIQTTRLPSPSQSVLPQPPLPPCPQSHPPAETSQSLYRHPPPARQPHQALAPDPTLSRERPQSPARQFSSPYAPPRAQHCPAPP